MLFIGDDWAEGHHDVVVQDEAGKTLARRRLPEGADGVARFHELAAAHWGGDGEPDPAQVVVVIETELLHVFRTGFLRLFHAAACIFRNSSMTSCGVRYPSPEWRRVRL